MKLIQTSQLVKTILTKYPITRGNDYLLWLKVIEAWELCNGFKGYAERVTVANFLVDLRQMDCPPFHSVSRARRKLQREYPELRATEKTQAARAELEEEYREYARTGI